MQLTDGIYHIQGLSVIELVQKYGSPLYLYDGQKMADQVEVMRQAFSGLDIKIKYAAKALTNIAVLQWMRMLGVDVDVVSIEEAHIALKAGFLPSQIQYTPSGVSFAEIDAAVQLGLRLNLDSIPLLEYVGEKYGNTLPVSIRVNPLIMAGGNLKISTGHADSKFGISILQMEQVAMIAQQFGIQIVGLHQHTGSDFKNARVIIEAAEKLFDLAFTFFPDIQFIDLGSGFKVAYSANDHVTDMQALGQEVVTVFKAFQEKIGRDIELWFEPGKFLVSESGILAVTANVVKENPNKTFVHVDSGLNHLIRPMMYDAYHEIVNISNPTFARGKGLYDVVGYICETDTFGKDRELPSVSQGDILGILNAGAYGFSMSSQYNSRVRPAEVLVVNQQDYLIRRRENLDDILQHQQMLPFE
ncbi:MAG: diaminopimelate decarboxylase [Spirosomataceae bacterium]